MKSGHGAATSYVRSWISHSERGSVSRSAPDLPYPLRVKDPRPARYPASNFTTHRRISINWSTSSLVL
jgi:hypothetical protein